MPDSASGNLLKTDEIASDTHSISYRWRTRDQVALGAAFLTATITSIVVISSDEVLTTDTSTYLISGRNLLDGNGFTRLNGSPELHFPPVPPIALGAMWKLLGNPIAALGVINTISLLAVLTLVANLAFRLGGTRAALIATWFTALTPAAIEIPFNRGGGSELMFVAFSLATLRLLLSVESATGPRRWLAAGGAGLCGALSYLTRPEGMLMFAGLSAVVIVATLVRLIRSRDFEAFRRDFMVLATVGLTFALAIFPQLAYLHSQTGRWELTSKGREVSIVTWQQLAENKRGDRSQIVYALDDDSHRLANEPVPLQQLATDNRGEAAEIIGVNLKTNRDLLFKPHPVPGTSIIRGGLLPPLLTSFAVIEIFLRRRRREVQLLVMSLAMTVLPTLLFFAQARYLIGVGIVAALLGSVALARLSSRNGLGFRLLALLSLSTAALLLIAPIVLSVGRFNTMFDPVEPLERKRAGIWLRTQAEPEDRLMTLDLATSFYSRLVAIPVPGAELSELIEFAEFHGVEYIELSSSLEDRYAPSVRALLTSAPPNGLKLAHRATYAGRTDLIFKVLRPRADTPDPPLLGFAGDD